jgi:hypothetical protein
MRPAQPSLRMVALLQGSGKEGVTNSGLPASAKQEIRPTRKARDTSRIEGCEREFDAGGLNRLGLQSTVVSPPLRSREPVPLRSVIYYLSRAANCLSGARLLAQLAVERIGGQGDVRVTMLITQVHAQAAAPPVPLLQRIAVARSKLLYRRRVLQQSVFQHAILTH